MITLAQRDFKGALQVVGNGELCAEVARLIADGQAAEKQSKAGSARRSYEEAMQSLDPETEGWVSPQLLRAIGRTLFEEGDVGGALDCFHAALESAKARNDPAEVANAYNSMAVTAFNRGEIPDALPLFHQAQKIADELGNMELVAMIEQNLGAISALRGETQDALGHYQLSLRAFRQQGLTDRVGPLLCNIGRLETELGQLAEAGHTLTEAVRQCTALGDVKHAILARINQARIDIAGEGWISAAERCEEARAWARSTGDTRWEGLILKQLGIVARGQDNIETALELLTEARGLAEAREDVVLQGEVAAELARIYRSQDRNRETLDALLKAHAVFKRVQADRALADIDLRLAEFEAIFLAIVQEWGESIDAKDAYTQGHCARVAEYALLIAESVGVDPKTLIWFRMGALLHDVGKMMIPDEILNKPGKLDEEEFEIVKQHPGAGETLLSGVGFPWDILPMVRHHHERWDGSGYPDRLSGQQIPLTARILCIADVFDALTTSRPYRTAMSLEKAMAIMESECGGAFDPELYALFVELLEAGALAPHLTARVPA